MVQQKLIAVFVSMLLALTSAQMLASQQEHNHNLTLTCTEDQDCPLWMHCKGHTCECKEELIHGNVKCDQYTGQLSVLDCYCVTIEEQEKDREASKVVAGSCILNCMNDGDLMYQQLPLNASDINKRMCGEFNRHGQLCGECLPGYSPLLFSFDMTCVNNCTDSTANVFKYLLLAFTPVTLFYYFILFFKVNATSSYLHGYVLFSQAISLPAFSRVMLLGIQHRYTQFGWTLKSALSLYGIWNLDFFRALSPGFCINLSTLSVLALDYTVAVYPILLTILSYILIILHERNFKPIVFMWKPFRHLFNLFRRNWEIRTSVIDAYATFYLLSFCKVISTTFDLLIPTLVHDLKSNDGTNYTVALYYDATTAYFGKKHLPYAILAIFMTVLVTLPSLILLLYSCRCVRIGMDHCHIRCQVVQTFIKSFQGSYKDGSEPGTVDCRWFAGFYLIVRIALYIVFSFTQSSLYFPLGMAVLILTLITVINVQPHKTEVAHYNTVNIMFLSLLALYYCALDANNIALVKASGFQFGLIILASIIGLFPIFYISCIVIYWLISRRGWGREFVDRVRAHLNRGNVPMDESIADRIENPDDYSEITSEHSCQVSASSSNQVSY